MGGVGSGETTSSWIAQNGWTLDACECGSTELGTPMARNGGWWIAEVTETRVCLASLFLFNLTFLG